MHTLAQNTNEKQAVKLESERASGCHNSVPSVGTARIQPEFKIKIIVSTESPNKVMFSHPGLCGAPSLENTD